MAPLAPPPVGLEDTQVHQLHHGAPGGEAAPPRHLAEARVDRLEGVRGAHGAPDRRVAVEQLPDVPDAAPPHGDRPGVPGPPGPERLPRGPGRRQGGRPVGRAHGPAEGRGLLLRDAPERAADEMGHAALVGRVREDGPRALPEPGHAVRAHVRHVLRPAGPELVEHLHPAVGPSESSIHRPGTSLRPRRS